MQISGGLDKHNPNVKVIHTAELLMEKRKDQKSSKYKNKTKNKKEVVFNRQY